MKISLLDKGSVYDILLFTLTFTLPFAHYLLPVSIGFMTLSPYRITLGVTMLLLIKNGDLTWKIGPVTKYLSYLLVLWIGYALISGFWVIDYGYYIKDIFYLLVGFASYLTLLSLYVKAKNPVKNFMTAWAAGFVILALFGIGEIFTGSHLVGNFTERIAQLHPLHPVKWVPVGTFDNPNNFSLYLVFSIVLILAALRQNRKYSDWMTVGIFYAIMITYINDARLGEGALVLMGVVYLVITKPISYFKLFVQTRFAKFAVLGVITVIMLLSVDEFKRTSQQFVADQSDDIEQMDIMEPAKPKAVNPNSSDHIRLGLIKNGWYYFVESFGFGVGAGNFDAYTLRGLGKYHTNKIVNPHNWTIQILSQYGILIFLPFAAWFLFVVYRLVLFRLKCRDEFLTDPYLVTGALLLVAYVVLSNASSSFMNNAINWTTLPLIAISTDVLWLKSNWRKTET